MIGNTNLSPRWRMKKQCAVRLRTARGIPLVERRELPQDVMNSVLLFAARSDFDGVQGIELVSLGSELVGLAVSVPVVDVDHEMV